jgi:phthalate 4,5-cis-dihydrodiol dehydrogenase
VEEITLPAENRLDVMLNEFYAAVVHGIRPQHDGAWGKATLEVTLAVLASSRERREVRLAHQVPVRD